MKTASWKPLVLALVGGVGAIAAAVAIFVPGIGLRAPRAALATTACPFESPADTPVECATLEVPALHGDSVERLRNRGTVTVFVATVRANARTPESDPVLVLADEPGQAGTDLLGRAWAAFDGLHQTRDILFVDTRGTGRARPALTCPGLDPVKVRLGGVTEAEAEADAKTCLDAARAAGVDPALVSSREVAADFAALRKALGLRSWNIVASGYGAVVAMEIVRRDAEGVRALVLDSPGAPKAGPTDLDRMAAIQRVYRQLFADCKARPDCARAYPRLEAAFESLVRRLDVESMPAIFAHPVTGAQVTGALTLPDFLSMVTRILGDGAGAAALPALIGGLDEATRGRSAGGDPVSALYAAFWRTVPAIADGAAAAVVCREIQPWVDLVGTRGMAEMFRPFVAPDALGLDHGAFCPVWKLPRTVEDPDAPPLEPPPTLMLTGEYDTWTPDYQAAALAPAIPAAQTRRLRGVGHGVLAVSACARDVVADFLESPSRKLDRGCAGEPPRFDLAPASALAAAVPAAAVAPAPASTPAPQPAPVAVPALAPSAPAPVKVAAVVPPAAPLAVQSPVPPGPAAPAAARAVATECPFAVPGSARVECGTVTLPERRDRPGGKTVSIFYAITRADGGNALPDPVLVLNGGPGQPGSDLIESGWDKLADVRKRRDIVYVDQRGTGYSQPGLYCRSLSPVAFWHGGFTAADAEDCLKPIRAGGYDVAAFNTVESAADLIAVRGALGIRQWNVLGTSYGTALAMEVVRRDGGAVRSVVLNSPTTPRSSWLDRGRMEAIRDVYRRVFADCAADAACASTYPGLDGAFLDLARRLTETPLPVTYQDPRTGATVRTSMTFANLLDILTMVVGSGTTAERVPALIWHLHRVVKGEDPPRPELLAWLYMPYWKTMDMIAYGLNAAIGCREVRSWIDPAKARAEGAAFEPYVMPRQMELDYDVFCPAWNLPRGPEELRQPVSSPVPVLLLTGDYDTLTPTGLADRVAKTLPNSQLLRFHAFGHDVHSASPCARAAASRFLDAPAEPVSLACLQSRRVPQFVARRR